MKKNCILFNLHLLLDIHTCHISRMHSPQSRPMAGMVVLPPFTYHRSSRLFLQCQNKHALISHSNSHNTARFILNNGIPLFIGI